MGEMQSRKIKGLKKERPKTKKVIQRKRQNELEGMRKRFKAAT